MITPEPELRRRRGRPAAISPLAEYRTWPLRADDALHAFAALGGALCGLYVSTDRRGEGRVQLQLHGDIDVAATAAAERMIVLAESGANAALAASPWDLLLGLGQQPDLSTRTAELWAGATASSIAMALRGQSTLEMRVSLRLELSHPSDAPAARRAIGSKPVPRLSSRGLNALAALALYEWQSRWPQSGATGRGDNRQVWRITPVARMTGQEWLGRLGDWPRWAECGSDEGMRHGTIDIWRHRVAHNARVLYLADPDRIVITDENDPTMALGMNAAATALIGGTIDKIASALGVSASLLERWSRGHDLPPRDAPVWRDLRTILHRRLSALGQVAEEFDRLTREARAPDD